MLVVDKNELMKEMMVQVEKVKKCDKRPNSDATVLQPSQKKKNKNILETQLVIKTNKNDQKKKMSR